jgi:hypothetical protein
MQKEIRTYAELQKQMRDALGEQHPDWVDPNGDCPTCRIYEERFNQQLALCAFRAESGASYFSASRAHLLASRPFTNNWNG